MQVHEFSLNSDREVIVKIVREVLNLFKIQVDENASAPDYQRFAVVNERLAGEPARVLTRLTVTRLDGTVSVFEAQGQAAPDEREGAAVHRLIKLNLYHLFREHFSLPPALWGILHGVRPTKIVHRFIAGGLTEPEVVARLRREYEAS